VVHEYHIALWDNLEYRRYLDAVYDVAAVRFSGARQWQGGGDDPRPRQRRLKTSACRPEVGSHWPALNVVLRRAGISRKERAHEVAGQIVDMNNAG
jgi:hypothetical protein